MIPNILGQKEGKREGWEERAARLAKPENFSVDIRGVMQLEEELSEEEITRLVPKLEMVAKFAAAMAAGMVKGTLKYSNDALSTKSWMEDILGESADFSNYIALLAAAFEKGEKSV